MKLYQKIQYIMYICIDLPFEIWTCYLWCIYALCILYNVHFVIQIIQCYFNSNMVNNYIFFNSYVYFIHITISEILNV